MSLYGGSTLGDIPFGHFAALDQSVRPKIADLLIHPEKRRYLLLQVEPYDPAGAAVVTRNFGAGLSRISGSTKLWGPRMLEAFNVLTRLELSEDLGLIGGEAERTYGSIQIAIADQPASDELETFLYDGRQFRVWLGGDPADAWTFADYSEVFRGLAEQATWNERRLELVVRNPSTRLDVPLQKTLYAGTGADEGGVDLKGKPKPIGYGRPRLVPAVLVDREYLIYQVHDGAILGAHSAADGDAVVDRGQSYTSDGNLPSVANLRAWTDVSGHYITDNALGLLRLGSSPTGVPTVSFRGATESGTFREKRGEVIAFLLRTRASFADADMDLGSLAGLNSGAAIDYYSDSPTTVRDSIASILAPRGFFRFDDTGRFAAGMVQIGTAVDTLRNEPSGRGPTILGMTRERTPFPAYRVSLGYARNWTPLNETELAPADETDVDRDFAINEYRRVIASSDTIWNPTAQTGKHPNAQDLTLDTLIQSEADAQIEVNDLMTLLGTTRDLYTVTCTRIAFRFRVGQTVRIVYPRFGLTGGRLFVILGVAETWRNGRTVLTVWG